MYTFYLLENFNNYYNRRIIRYETINEYLTHQTNLGNEYAIFNANFIPNDGVTTEHIVNSQQLNIDWNPNYIVLVDENNNIYQRWFVLDSVRTTMGQYRLSMKRDSISDFYTESLNSTCFVEKATLDDDNPMIYNKENFNVNQIKQSEEFLKDKTNTPWIVGYLSNKDLDIGSLDGAKPVPDTGTPNYYEFEIVGSDRTRGTEITSLASQLGVPMETIGIDGAVPEYSFTTTAWLSSIQKTSRFFEFNFEVGTPGPNKYSVAYVFNENGQPSNALTKNINKLSLNRKASAVISAGNIRTGAYLITHGAENWQIAVPGSITAEGFTNNIKEVSDNIVNSFNTPSNISYMDSAWSYVKGVNGDLYNACKSVVSQTEADLLSHVGKYYYETSTGTSYYVKNIVTVLEPIYTEIKNIHAVNHLKSIFIGSNSNLKQFMEEPDKYGPEEEAFYIGVLVPKAYFAVERYSVDKIKYQLPVKLPNLKDNPFKMFCMPMDKTIFRSDAFTPGTITNYQTSPDIPFRVAMDISKKLSGAGWLTDLQILPYCPCQYWITKSTSTTYPYSIRLPDDNVLEHNQFTWIKTVSGSNNTERVRSFMLFPTRSSVSFEIEKSITIANKKLENQCDFVRLCSPNYASAFEFTPAKNNGVNYFTVNMTLKPYNPFIQIYPNFKELYGDNFNDNRGLILAGDFSLPQVNDAWNTYELNNKTYQASFDRQIQNMETMHKYGTIEAVIGATAGAVGGIAGGAAVAGPLGAIAGGVMGVAGGAADLALRQFRFNETLDYTKDMFGFSLENIQALPQTLSKTSALTINHKLFPFIEFYSCTDIEKQAFLKKLKYNGMTVGVISELGIAPYIRNEETYIKAKLIEININDDAHIANDIAAELDRGVRIKK